MNIMLHYIQFTVYVVISSKLNLGVNKKKNNLNEITNRNLPHMKTAAVFWVLCYSNKPTCYLLYLYLIVM